MHIVGQMVETSIVLKVKETGSIVQVAGDYEMPHYHHMLQLEKVVNLHPLHIIP